MELKIQSPHEFHRLLEALAFDIQTANIRYRLYGDLMFGVQGEYTQEIAQSPTFWQLTVQSILDSCVFYACRIYEQNNTTLNLKNLLDTVKTNLHIFSVDHFRERLKGNSFVDSLCEELRPPDPEQLEKDIAFVSTSNALVKNLTIWRNNIFAHTNPQKAIRGLMVIKADPLEDYHIGSLLDQALQIINRYSRLFVANTYSGDMVGRTDFYSVLESVREHLQAVEKKTADDIQRAQSSIAGNNSGED